MASGAAPVDSVVTRTGAVVAATSDYDAIQIDSTPAGTITATNVQDALDELDTLKSPTTHDHAGVYSPVGHDHDLEYAPIAHVGTGGETEHPKFTQTVAGFVPPPVTAPSGRVLDDGGNWVAAGGIDPGDQAKLDHLAFGGSLAAAPTATVEGAIAIGDGADATAANAVALGTDALADRAEVVDMAGTGALRIPRGLIGETPAVQRFGDIRYDTTDDRFYGWDQFGFLTFGTNPVPLAEAGSTYTFADTDRGRLVRFTSAVAVAVTIPTNAVTAFPVGTEIHAIQAGTGQITVGGAGVTINFPDTAKTRKQFSAVTMIKVGVDEWDLMGDLAAA